MSRLEDLQRQTAEARRSWKWDLLRDIEKQIELEIARLAQAAKDLPDLPAPEPDVVLDDPVAAPAPAPTPPKKDSRKKSTRKKAR